MALLSGAARAQEAASPPAEPALRDLCTDRPSKANGACTVDRGHVQVEVDAVDVTTNRESGVTTDVYAAAAPTLKYGLTDTVDVEASFDAVTVVRTTGPAGVASRTLSGFGDIDLRAKIGLPIDPGGPLSATVLPFIKAPTARLGIGNGAWEGGVIVPVVWKLSNTFSLTFDPELDVLKNDQNDGRHLAMIQLVNLTWAVTKTINLQGELWSNVNFDPERSVKQYSADLATTYALMKDVQLDCGVNFGLNRDTPALQVYAGVSHRF